MHRASSGSATSGPPTQRRRVVVIGGGFGGLQAQHLASAPVDLTVVDRGNFRLFEPLTYQVATGALSGGTGRTEHALLETISAGPGRVRAMLAAARQLSATVDTAKAPVR
jgi:NADH dehydrogenase FAD-containing subunit